MDDCILTARLDEHTTLYVSPIHRRTYAEHVGEDNLGGDQGYFVARSLSDGETVQFDILAKATSFEAAGDLFDMIVKGANGAAYAAR